jgi:NADPH-dependent glutamate synthase beta subunit-like oxidoreductase/CO/xanthine dehydrogenase FAD-binding subunit
MTQQPIKYISADNLQMAESLLKEHKGRSVVVAGGTDQMGLLKDAVHSDSPQVLIGLKPVKDFRYVKTEADRVRIGALTTLNDIAKDPSIQKTYPLLAQAAASVASPQIRNVATIAGNLCQEPRCWYYRNPDNNFDCLRKGGKWCDALFAENRYHSIFGGICVSAAPCNSGCPIHNDIPAYMAKIREGKIEEAVEILLRTNPLAAITGRICSHYCEESCNRFDYDEPVSIRNVERYLGDYALEHCAGFYPAPSIETGKKVAIVGSGPTGLTTAYFLRKQGHSVTIYEQMPVAGGMLKYSIPEYRLPKAVVQAQVDALKDMGIKFELGQGIGMNGLTLEDLKKKYQGVFLATGLWNGKKLRLEKGELLDSGLEFLIDVQTGKSKPMGKRILVIGGGSVAVDVALTAHRLGAKQVTMACLETLETMPAIPEDIVQAQQEGIAILPSWGPQQVLDREGKLAGMEFVRCTSVFDKDGRFTPVFDVDQKTTVEVDQVLVAIGQSADISYFDSSLKTERGMVFTEKGSTSTSMEGIFAGGDVTGRSATVVHGMASGKEAAIAIDAYLAGTEVAPSPIPTGLVPLVINKAALATSERVITPEVDLSERNLLTEDFKSLPKEAVDAEALRCANCGCVAVNCSDVATALIALDAQVISTQRTLAAEQLFAAGENSTTVLADDELIKEIWIPTPSPESRQSYLKFRIRNSIDFPIVSVAFKSTMQDGRFHDSRVVLGAVSPIPLRARLVEDLLEGKAPGEMLANEAANLAVSNAQPLARNKAQVEVLKALINKTIRKS